MFGYTSKEHKLNLRAAHSDCKVDANWYTIQSPTAVHSTLYSTLTCHGISQIMYTVKSHTNSLLCAFFQCHHHGEILLKLDTLMSAVKRIDNSLLSALSRLADIELCVSAGPPHTWPLPSVDQQAPYSAVHSLIDHSPFQHLPTPVTPQQLPPSVHEPPTPVTPQPPPPSVHEQPTPVTPQPPPPSVHKQSAPTIDLIDQPPPTIINLIDQPPSQPLPHQAPPLSKQLPPPISLIEQSPPTLPQTPSTLLPVTPTEQQPLQSPSVELLSLEQIMRLKTSSSSRMNFSANLNRRLFTISERTTCNVRGKTGKGTLDPERIAYIKRVTFRLFPLENLETEKAAWGACITAMDEANRRLNKAKK